MEAKALFEMEVFVCFCLSMFMYLFTFLLIGHHPISDVPRDRVVEIGL